MKPQTHNPDAKAAAVFRDLRRRNERRARDARLAEARRERLLNWERSAQVQRERRFGRAG